MAGHIEEVAVEILANSIPGQVALVHLSVGEDVVVVGVVLDTYLLMVLLQRLHIQNLLPLRMPSQQMMGQNPLLTHLKE